jgi:hypothetical protein
MLLRKKEEHIAIYRRHNRGVRQYFSGRETGLLDVCREEGDEWDGLCTLLNRLTPNKPLPHEKRGPSELLSRLSYGKNMIRYTTLFPYPIND